MKRIISVFLSVLLSVSFVSCARNESNAPAFSRGRVVNNVYESKFARLRFSPGPSWLFESDDDILNRNGVENDGLSEDEICKRLNELDTVYDMIAEHGTSGIKVIVLFENFVNSVERQGITIDDYILKLKTDLETKYSGSAAEVVQKDDETVAGTAYKCIEVLLKNDAGDVKQVYLVRDIDGFIMSLCITAPANIDPEKDILDLFDPIGD